MLVQTCLTTILPPPLPNPLPSHHHSSPSSLLVQQQHRCTSLRPMTCPFSCSILAITMQSLTSAFQGMYMYRYCTKQPSTIKMITSTYFNVTSVSGSLQSCLLLAVAMMSECGMLPQVRSCCVFQYPTCSAMRWKSLQMARPSSLVSYPQS